MRLACLLKGKRRQNTPPPPKPNLLQSEGARAHPPPAPPQPNPASPTPRAPTGGRGPACPGRSDGWISARGNATGPLRGGSESGDCVTASASAYEPPRSAVLRTLPRSPVHGESSGLTPGTPAG